MPGRFLDRSFLIRRYLIFCKFLWYLGQVWYPLVYDNLYDISQIQLDLLTLLVFNKKSNTKKTFYSEVQHIKRDLGPVYWLGTIRPDYLVDKTGWCFFIYPGYENLYPDVYTANSEYMSNILTMFCYSRGGFNSLFHWFQDSL